jgi:hypothetical protein
MFAILNENYEAHSKFVKRIGVAAPDQPRGVRREVAAASSSDVLAFRRSAAAGSLIWHGCRGIDGS